jgi:hypothetical protein
MSPYDFGAFLRSVQDLDYLEILQAAEQQVYGIEPGLSRVRGAPERRRLGGGKYVAKLKKLLFFMRSGVRPGGIDEVDFQAYRPVCVSLVRRGQFKPEILDLFRQS